MNKTMKLSPAQSVFLQKLASGDKLVRPNNKHYFYWNGGVTKANSNTIWGLVRNKLATVSYLLSGVARLCPTPLGRRLSKSH